MRGSKRGSNDHHRILKSSNVTGTAAPLGGSRQSALLANKQNRDKTVNVKKEYKPVNNSASTTTIANDDSKEYERRVRERFERDFLPRFGEFWRNMAKNDDMNDKENKKVASTVAPVSSKPETTYSSPPQKTAMTIAPKHVFNFMDAIERNEPVSITVTRTMTGHDEACGCGCVPPVVEEDEYDADVTEIDTDNNDLDDDGTKNVFDMSQLREHLPPVNVTESDDDSDNMTIADGHNFVDAEAEEFNDDYNSTSSTDTEEDDIGVDRGKKRTTLRKVINLMDTDDEDDNSTEENEFEFSSSGDESDSTSGFESPSVIVIDSESDESNQEVKQKIPETKSNSRERPKRNTNTGSAFQNNRDMLTKSAFREFNRDAFGGILSAVEVVWNKKLKTTAGLTRLTKCKTSMTPGVPLKRIATIELSTKVLDSNERLRTTLLHEMVHAAVWIADGKSKPPHGADFKRWARNAMKRIPNVKVTTTHSYEIDFKYIWECSTPGCGSSVKRHSKSFDPTKYHCIKCKGSFVPVQNRSGRKQAKPSAYNLFVKEESKRVRQKLLQAQKDRGIPNPKVAQADVIRACALLWKEHKAALI